MDRRPPLCGRFFLILEGHVRLSGHTVAQRRRGPTPHSVAIAWACFHRLATMSARCALALSSEHSTRNRNEPDRENNHARRRRSVGVGLHIYRQPLVGTEQQHLLHDPFGNLHVTHLSHGSAGRRSGQGRGVAGSGRAGSDELVMQVPARRATSHGARFRA